MCCVVNLCFSSFLFWLLYLANFFYSFFFFAYTLVSICFCTNEIHWTTTKLDHEQMVECLWPFIPQRWNHQIDIVLVLSLFLWMLWMGNKYQINEIFIRPNFLIWFYALFNGYALWYTDILVNLKKIITDGCFCCCYLHFIFGVWCLYSRERAIFTLFEDHNFLHH